MAPRRIAFVYGTALGEGGLGVQAANALRALALTGWDVHAIGPGPAAHFDISGLARVTWHTVPPLSSQVIARSPLRWRAGMAQWWRDRRLGRQACARLERIRPDACYAFTQVALESLRWARRAGVPTVLESPNGHIRNFRGVYAREARTLCGARYHGHPARGMVARVEAEYRLAGRIRVSSEWARHSLMEGGVPDVSISVLQQPIDLQRYRPSSSGPRATDVLRVCFVGSLDLRKGFAYLLQAVRQMRGRVSAELIGATGDRCCRRLLARERDGLEVRVAPGDPRPAFARSDLFVLPTLEDGSPFATAEAMASGLPVLTTPCNGGAEWLKPDITGWIAAPRSAPALADVFERAAAQIGHLRAMGLQARLDTERRAGPECDRLVADWIAA